MPFFLNACDGEEELDCPWCGKSFKVDLLSGASTLCPFCDGHCFIWLDGDIDFNSPYLTRKGEEK